MGQRIVGQKEPWWRGHGLFLGILLTGVVLMLIIFWLNWPRP